MLALLVRVMLALLASALLPSLLLTSEPLVSAMLMVLLYIEHGGLKPIA